MYFEVEIISWEDDVDRSHHVQSHSGVNFYMIFRTMIVFPPIFFGHLPRNITCIAFMVKNERFTSASQIVILLLFDYYLFFNLTLKKRIYIRTRAQNRFKEVLAKY